MYLVWKFTTYRFMFLFLHILLASVPTQIRQVLLYFQLTTCWQA